MILRSCLLRVQRVTVDNPSPDPPSPHISAYSPTALRRYLSHAQGTLLLEAEVLRIFEAWSWTLDRRAASTCTL